MEMKINSALKQLSAVTAQTHDYNCWMTLPKVAAELV